MFRLTLAALVLLATLLASTSVANADNATPTFEEIDRYIEEQRQARRIPGIALGIVRDGEIVHVRGFGEADSSGRPVSPQTPFIIGSLTKSFTAVAIMQLAEAGKLELDAPVQRYLPWFRVADADASERIALRHLLYQTSGLPASAGNAGIADGDVSDASLERHVRALHSVQLAHPVGATHVYSNANYLILGLIVQTVAGQTYEAYVQDRIFTPLDMRRSFTSRDAARAAGLAIGHRYWLGVPRPAELPYPRGLLPAGYLISSAEDMARYLTAYQRALLYGDTTLLSRAGMAELQRPGVEAGDPAASYAMGWSVVQDGDVRVIGHSGQTFDFRGAMSFVPERGLGMVLLMNADTALGRARLTDVSTGVYSMLLGRELPASSANNGALLIYGVLLAAVLTQLVGMLRTVALLRRRGDHVPAGAHGGRWLARHVGLPLFTNLAWAGLALVLVPALLAGSLSLLTLQIPDVGYTLVVSGGVALAWAIIRTLLSPALRTAHRASAA